MEQDQVQFAFVGQVFQLHVVFMLWVGIQPVLADKKLLLGVLLELGMN